MKEIIREELPSCLKDPNKKALYLYTPLCGTCQLASKMLDVVEHVVSNVSFYKLDLNYAPDFAEAYSIESVPCLLIMNGETVLEKIYAFHSVAYLYDVFQKQAMM
jgi:thioredoxin 1